MRTLGISVAAALAGVAGVTIYVAPGIAIATPTDAAPLKDTSNNTASQRLQVAQAQVSGQSAAATLPGGASSLNETYKDWRVACAMPGEVKRCVLSQTLVQQNGQRVLAIELNSPAGNTVSGALVLPFGLALESGVALQVDDKPAMPPIRFRTCLPAGCVVNVTFDAPALVALRTGTALKVNAVADGGAATPFSISLQGFGAALDRVGVLSR